MNEVDVKVVAELNEENKVVAERLGELVVNLSVVVNHEVAEGDTRIERLKLEEIRSHIDDTVCANH